MSRIYRSCLLVVFTCWILVSFLPAGAQNLFPYPGLVFNDERVPEVHITIDPDSLSEIFAHPESDHEYPAVFEFIDGFYHDVVEPVGFRLRGNTSRNAQKKSFKVSFNRFVPGQHYFGLEKMNLNGEHNDPSVIRSKAGWEICRLLDIPASRSNHVRLYVNDEYYGLYIHVEHVDEEFVNLRYGSKSGNLYKCLWPASLTWLGPDPDAYRREHGGRRVYELKTNLEQDDYSDLMHFIDVLNHTPADELTERLPEVFNIDRYLSVMVMDVFTGNWDGPLYNKNNFYLYHDPASGLFEYIPYDLDNTFGIDWMGVDWSQRNVYDWSPGWDYLPLYERIMAVPAYREEFTRRFHSFLDAWVDTGYLEARILEIRTRIQPWIQDDPYYSLDYGWDSDDFERSYEEALGQHVKSGLIPYIEQRTASARTQLDGVATRGDQLAWHEAVEVYPNPAADYLTVRAEPGSEFSLRDASGRLMLNWKHCSTDLQRIPLTGLSAGWYMIISDQAVRQPFSRILIIR